jgi:hypothetical protein
MPSDDNFKDVEEYNNLVKEHNRVVNEIRALIELKSKLDIKIAEFHLKKSV